MFENSAVFKNESSSDSRFLSKIVAAFRDCKVLSIRESFISKFLVKLNVCSYSGSGLDFS